MNEGRQKIALGCYTDTAHPNGLKMLELDEGSGAMSVIADFSVSNALYQTFPPDGKYIYSCAGEGLASFLAEGLKPVDSIPLGNCICHVSAMPDGKRVVFAGYLGGFAGSVEVADGRLGQVVKHQHSGCGPNLPRQSCAHCHQAIPTPDGKGYCVVYLGLDQIVEYPSGRVFRASPAGAGPRHLLFHPNGRLAFLVYELGNFVSSLSWSPADGFKLLDTYSTVIDLSRKERKDYKGELFTNSTRSARSARLNNPVNPVNPVQTLTAAARHFVKRIAFIHVRDVEGTKEDFTELFHDQGDTDQFALMRTYREIGLDVPVRGDHVPEMVCDRVLTPEGTAGYFKLGRLFANGYLKALLKATDAIA